MKKSLFLALIMILSLSAQWSSDPAHNLQISTFGYYVDACEDGNGGAFVCWRTTADNPTVWVQWVDKFGYARWPQPVQVTGAGLGQTNNRIIKTSDNAAVIAFGDQYVGDTFDVPPWVIYKTYITLNKIDTTGILLWGENGVRVTVDTAQQQDLVIIPDETGGAYLTWNDRFPVGGDPDSMIIRLQRISYEGQRMWGDSGRYVYKAPRNFYNFPFISNRLPDGLFFLYLEKDEPRTIEYIEPDGNIIWKKQNEWYKRMMPTQDGGAAWAFKHRISHTGEYLILANRMDSEGNLMWSDSGLVIDRNIPYNKNISDEMLLQDNSLVVYYGKNRPYSYIQIINSGGTFVFPDSSARIGSNPDGNVSGLKIQLSDYLHFILSWHETDTENPGYYVQKFNKNMEPQWNNHGVLYSAKEVASGKLMKDNNNGVITIWHEFFSPDVGIFGQQISKDGNLGEILTGLEPTNNTPNIFRLFQNYPNPFNNSTIIPFFLPEQKHINISVYNTIGQKVKELFNGDKQSGYHRVIWNGADQNNRPVSSGVYYIKLESDNKQKIIKTLLIK